MKAARWGRIVSWLSVVAGAGFMLVIFLRDPVPRWAFDGFTLAWIVGGWGGVLSKPDPRMVRLMLLLTVAALAFDLVLIPRWDA